MSLRPATRSRVALSNPMADAYTQILGPREIRPTGRSAFWQATVEKGKIRSQERLVTASLPKTANLGLVYHRYMPAHDQALNASGKSLSGMDASAVRQLASTQAQGVKADIGKRLSAAVTTWSRQRAMAWFIDSARAGARQQRALFGGLHRRRAATVARQAGREFALAVSWRLVTGLGLPSSFENAGLAFDWTYGFPTISGSSFKGVTAHFLNEEVAFDLPSRRSSLIGELEAVLTPAGWEALLLLRPSLAPSATLADLSALLFGRPGVDGEEGSCAFLDGWPQPAVEDQDESWLALDVVTPHHAKYYSGDARALDSDEPQPHHFLTIGSGVSVSIGLVLTSRGRRTLGASGSAAVAFAEELLRQALETWGVGAKTGSGYGRMSE